MNIKKFRSEFLNIDSVPTFPNQIISELDTLNSMCTKFDKLEMRIIFILLCALYVCV